MSEWIRIGRDHLWHRVGGIEYVDAISRGEFRLSCGERLPTSGGWQNAVDELVPPDDQHPPCRNRALREAYWRGRIGSGNLVDITRLLTVPNSTETLREPMAPNGVAA